MTPLEAHSDHPGPAGYRHHLYAESFANVGSPLALPRSGGWLIERRISDTQHYDGMGCYPLFDCDEWSALAEDLSSLRTRLATVTLVTNPFANVDVQQLGTLFDVVMPFKRHYVVDLCSASALSVRRRHRRNVRRALRDVHVHECVDPQAYLDEWCVLYGELMRRHRGHGIAAFSRDAFEKQLRVPGLVMLRAAAEGVTVGLHLWYLDGQVAYGHLGATSRSGHDLMASYALYWHATQCFRGRVRWLNLGGVPGRSETGGGDGLRQFKAGWATETRQAFLCGRVLQPDTYDRLVSSLAHAATNYFPAYRIGEVAEIEMSHEASVQVP